jgi:PhnB protein
VRFYRRVFGADELLRNHGPDGRVMHCELLINGGRLLLHDPFGHQWSLATPREDLSVADQEARGDQWARETDWPRQA